jgi:hypothetical protein
MDSSMRLILFVPLIANGLIFGAIPFYETGQEQSARKSEQSELFQHFTSVGKYSTKYPNRFEGFLHSSVKACAKSVSGFDMPPALRANYVKGLSVIYKSAVNWKTGDKLDEKTKVKVDQINADQTSIAVTELGKLPKEKLNSAARFEVHL